MGIDFYRIFFVIIVTIPCSLFGAWLGCRLTWHCWFDYGDVTFKNLLRLCHDTLEKYFKEFYDDEGLKTF